MRGACSGTPRRGSGSPRVTRATSPRNGGVSGCARPRWKPVAPSHLRSGRWPRRRRCPLHSESIRHATLPRVSVASVTRRPGRDTPGRRGERMLPRPRRGPAMDGLDIRLEESEHRLVLRLTGTLDGRTADAVSQAVRELPPLPLTVDFSQVRTFVDLSVDALTRALRDRPVSLTGLGRHQARMFRYFGLLTDELEQPAEACTNGHRLDCRHPHVTSPA